MEVDAITDLRVRKTSEKEMVDHAFTGDGGIIGILMKLCKTGGGEKN